MYIDDRALYEEEGPVPEAMYTVPIGRGARRRPGTDVTVVATSSLAPEALRAGEVLASRGIEAEVIDLRSIKPWDKELVLDSVAKTGRLVVADAAWRTCGFTAEVAATVAEAGFGRLRAPIARVTLPDAPAPTSGPLERAYFVGRDDIIAAVERTLSLAGG